MASFLGRTWNFPYVMSSVGHAEEPAFTTLGFTQVCSLQAKLTLDEALGHLHHGTHKVVIICESGPTQKSPFIYKTEPRGRFPVGHYRVRDNTLQVALQGKKLLSLASGKARKKGHKISTVQEWTCMLRSKAMTVKT